LESVY